MRGRPNFSCAPRGCFDCVEVGHETMNLLPMAAIRLYIPSCGFTGNVWVTRQSKL